MSHLAAEECKEKGWEIYLACTPGTASNFATSPVTLAVVSGDSVSCHPPFMSARRRVMAPL
eukprot:5310273-Pleurochrysis_carterae.AAC.5